MIVGDDHRVVEAAIILWSEILFVMMVGGWEFDTGIILFRFQMRFFCTIVVVVVMICCCCCYYTIYHCFIWACCIITRICCYCGI